MQYRIKFFNIAQTEIYFDWTDEKMITPATIDIDSWSYGYDAYSVRLKRKPSIFQVFNETIDTRLVAQLEYNDTQVYLSDGGTLDVDDYVWIEDELVQLVSYNGTGDYWNVLRGQKGTRRKAHFFDSYNDNGIQCFVKGRHTPIGLECMIYDYKGDAVFYGYIAEMHSNGAGVELSIDNILNKLDKELVMVSPASGFTLYTMLYTYTGLEAILPVAGLPDPTILYHNYGTYEVLNLDEKIFKFNPKEKLEAFLLLNVGFLTWNTSGFFEVKLLEQQSTFSPSTLDVDIFRKMRQDGAYVSKLTQGGKSVAMSYNYKAEDFENGWEQTFEERTVYVNPSSLVANYNTDVLELSITAIEPPNFYSNFEENRNFALGIARKIVRVFGLILGELEIDVNPTSGLIVGEYYELPAKEYIWNFVPSNIDAVALCVGISDNRAKFVILEEQNFSPVAPSVLVKNSGTSTDVTVYTGFKALRDYINTAESDLEDADSPVLDIYYFEDGDAVTLWDKDTGALVASTTIASISGDVVTLNTSVDASNKLIMTYALYTSADTTQQKFLYNDEGAKV